MWGFLKDHPKFIGFEYLPWGSPLLPFWPRMVLNEAKKRGLRVVGIHGRVGREFHYKTLRSRVMVPIYNEFMVTTKTMLSELASRVDYLLLHNIELVWPGVEQLILKYRKNIRCLFIENHNAGDAIGEMIRLAGYYQAKGLTVGLTFDLFHYMHMLLPGGPYTGLWPKTLDQLDRLLTLAAHEGYQFELHLPIGEALDDSLPPEIGVVEYKQLAKVIEGRIDYLTVESHPFTRDFLVPSRGSKIRLLRRNQENIEKLQQAGLI